MEPLACLPGTFAPVPAFADILATEPRVQLVAPWPRVRPVAPGPPGRLVALRPRARLVALRPIGSDADADDSPEAHTDLEDVARTHGRLAARGRDLQPVVSAWSALGPASAAVVSAWSALGPASAAVVPPWAAVVPAWAGVVPAWAAVEQSRSTDASLLEALARSWSAAATRRPATIRRIAVTRRLPATGPEALARSWSAAATRRPAAMRRPAVAMQLPATRLTVPRWLAAPRWFGKFERARPPAHATAGGQQP